MENFEDCFALLIYPIPFSTWIHSNSNHFVKLYHYDVKTREGNAENYLEHLVTGKAWNVPKMWKR